MKEHRFEPADIDEVWDRIEPGLRVIKARTKAAWDLDYVRTTVRAGDAQLMVSPEGFLIWRIKVCEFTGRVVFWVWVAYGEGGGIIERYEDQLVELARCCGAEALAFDSNRRGYLRRLRKNWSVTQVTYERDVR